MRAINTVAVTGASGHLGNTVCRLLVENGYRVHALYHSDKRALEDQNVTLFHGSILEKKDLLALFQNCNAVINCAAIISIHGDPTGIVHRTNTEGPANVIAAAIEAGVSTLIHVSSVHAVLEHPLTTAFDETRPYKTTGSFAYDFSKAAGEQLVLDAFRSGKISGCVVRPSLIIGPYDAKPSEIGKALIDFYRQKIPALPQGGYNFVDVRDVAASIVAALEKGRNGEIYHLTGTYYTLKALGDIIRSVTGKKVPRLVLPFWVLRASLPFIKTYSRVRGAAPVFTKEAIAALASGHPNMVNTKAATELQHQTRSLETSVRDFYDWQQAQHPLL